MSGGSETTTDPPAALDAWLAAAHERPKECALFLDVDGTLAPVVERTDDARVPTDVSRILGHLSARLGMVACVSGRAAADAKRLVGVGGIVYAGAHGAELLDPATGEIERAPELEAWKKPVQDFVATLDRAEMRRVGVRLEDKKFIQALHWRGAELEEEAEELVHDAEAGASELGFEIHHGRKVLEIRPPIHFNKGVVVDRLVRQSGLQYAAYIGDDNTDVDAFEALLELRAHGDIEVALCIGVASEEAPAQLVARADAMVEGPPGVSRLLQEI
ncbi:MAG: trehalose-phosphatase [Solirubrobacterales bacterium]